MKRVTVIIPTHNRAHTIGRAIESVLAQTYGDFELIIVDDASSDNTSAVLGPYLKAGVGHLRLPERRGAAGARNAGIQSTQSDLIAFQDSDDEWLPEKLRKQVETLDGSSSDVGVVYTDMLRVMRGVEEAYLAAPDVDSSDLINPRSKQYSVQNIGIQSALLRRALLAKVGYFNESLPALEDLELFIRLSRACRFHRLAEALVKYHETEGISSNRQNCAEARKSLLALYEQDLIEHKWFVAQELASIAGLQTVAGPRE